MKKFKQIFVVAFALILLFVIKTLWQAGTFKQIEPHFEGKIYELSGMIGVEDITIDQTTDLAFLSSDDRRATLAKKPIKGTIYLLNLNEKDPKPISLTDDFPQNDFHPHGISLWKSPQNESFLFVVNHRESGAFVEIFQFTQNKLVHKETIFDPLIISPNDIVGVGERSFYVTNDHNIPLGIKRTIMDFMLLGNGNVIYFNGRTAYSMAEGIQYANGINVSSDGKKIFLASTTGRKIYVYDRNVVSGNLSESDEIELSTGPDNIELDQEGNLWVACHPKMLAFTQHAKDKNKISPSEILKIGYNGKGNSNIERLYLSNGKQISGSSVCAIWENNTLLIGSVFESKILIGEIK